LFLAYSAEDGNAFFHKGTRVRQIAPPYRAPNRECAPITQGMRQAVRLTRAEYAQVLLARGEPGDAERAADLLHAVLADLEAADLGVLADFVRAQLDGLARLPG